MTSPLDYSPAPGAASAGRRVRSQTVLELGTTLRNGEQLLLTLGIPLILLVALTVVPILDLGTSARIDVVTPGILALAVMSTAFTGLAIATGFDRRAGALKFLGSTPLSRGQLLTAKFFAVVVTEVVQVALITAVALLLGWHPHGSPFEVVTLLLMGTAAFCSLGFALSGLLRAEATLAVANAIYLLLLLGGGVIIPTDRLPAAWSAIASGLPSGALANGLRTVLITGATLPWSCVAILAVWTVIGVIVAVKTFRWE